MRQLRREEIMTLHFLRERGTWCLDELEPDKQKVFAKILRGLVRFKFVEVEESGAGPSFRLADAGFKELGRIGDSID